MKTFELTVAQEQRIESWRTKHKALEHDRNTVQRQVSYMFSHASGIGLSVTVRCACGDSLDVTEYEKW